MKTIQLTIDEPLLERVDCAAREQHSARSEFIRSAIERELRRIAIREAERQYADAYRKQPLTAEEIDGWEAVRGIPEDEDWSSWDES
jgi:metal-responsive CopG/Arc/MetJ family transcriptional regulator